MSKFAFNHRDRLDPNSVKPERVRYMARSGGFVMVKIGRSKPFVLSEKEWARLPLFEDQA